VLPPGWIAKIGSDDFNSFVSRERGCRDRKEDRIDVDCDTVAFREPLE
jgi:hypothetical protein